MLACDETLDTGREMCGSYFIQLIFRDDTPECPEISAADNQPATGRTPAVLRVLARRILWVVLLRNSRTVWGSDEVHASVEALYSASRRRGSLRGGWAQEFPWPMQVLQLWPIRWGPNMVCPDRTQGHRASAGFFFKSNRGHLTISVVRETP